MNRFKISTRVSALAGLMSLLLLCIGGLGLWGLVQTNQALRSLYQDNLVTTSEMHQIEALLLRNRLALAVAQVTPDAATIQSSTTEVENNIAAITRLWDGYLARPTMRKSPHWPSALRKTANALCKRAFW